MFIAKAVPCLIPQRMVTTDFMSFGASNVTSSSAEPGLPNLKIVDSPTVGRSAAGKLYTELPAHET